MQSLRTQRCPHPHPLPLSNTLNYREARKLPSFSSHTPKLHALTVHFSSRAGLSITLIQYGFAFEIDQVVAGVVLPAVHKALQHDGLSLGLKIASVAFEMTVLDGSGCCRYRRRYVAVALFCAASLTWIS